MRTILVTGAGVLGLLLTCSSDPASARAPHLRPSAGKPSPAQLTPLEPCSSWWSQRVGGDLVREFWEYSAVKDPEFIAWLLSIAWTESHMQAGARSPAGALGMLQLTSEGALEAALMCDLPQLVTPRELDRLMSRKTAIVYGSCLLSKYLNDARGNWQEALILYNGGYRQLNSYLGKSTMVTETRDYVLAAFHTRYQCRGPQSD